MPLTGDPLKTTLVLFFFIGWKANAGYMRALRILSEIASHERCDYGY
jgi:hypothetical protein